MNTIERTIARWLVRSLITEGYVVSVNDGEETTIHNSCKEREIMEALGTTDEDYRHTSHAERGASWVRLIYGNDEDVISDYGVSLEPVIQPIYQWIERRVSR